MSANGPAVTVYLVIGQELSPRRYKLRAGFAPLVRARHLSFGGPLLETRRRLYPGFPSHAHCPVCYDGNREECAARRLTPGEDFADVKQRRVEGGFSFPPIAREGGVLKRCVAWPESR